VGWFSSWRREGGCGSEDVIDLTGLVDSGHRLGVFSLCFA